jgi:hypothetical protein
MINRAFAYIHTRKKSPVWVYRRSKEDDEIKLETWKMVNRKKNQRHSARVSFAPHRKRTKDNLTGRSIEMG